MKTYLGRRGRGRKRRGGGGGEGSSSAVLSLYAGYKVPVVLSIHCSCELLYFVSIKSKPSFGGKKGWAGCEVLLVLLSLKLCMNGRKTFHIFHYSHLYLQVGHYLLTFNLSNCQPPSETQAQGHLSPL